MNDKHVKLLRKVCFIVVQYGRKLLAVVGIATRLHAKQPKYIVIFLVWKRFFWIWHSEDGASWYILI